MLATNRLQSEEDICEVKAIIDEYNKPLEKKLKANMRRLLLNNFPSALVDIIFSFANYDRIVWFNHAVNKGTYINVDTWMYAHSAFGQPVGKTATWIFDTSDSVRVLSTGDFSKGVRSGQWKELDLRRCSAGCDRGDSYRVGDYRTGMDGVARKDGLWGYFYLRYQEGNFIGDSRRQDCEKTESLREQKKERVAPLTYA